jgi:long-chain acyl-CoA synthetase
VALGDYLMQRGFTKGDTVSLMMPNGYQTTILFLGVMYAGMTVAPINLHLQPSLLEYVIDHSDTRLVFVDKKETDRLQTARKQVDRHIDVIIIDIDAASIVPNGGEPDTVLPPVQEKDSALLLYTSGTTGKPKGVVLSHGNVVAGGAYTAQAHQLTPDDRGLCSLPLYHINAEIVSAVAPLLSGGSVVMPHRFSVSDFWELISTYRCTWFSVVPTIISYLAAGSSITDKKLNLDPVRFGRSASSALPSALHKAFEKQFGISIIETMGLTETAAPVFSNPLDPKVRKYGSPGPAVGNRVKIVDRKGREVAPEVVGEIMVKGDNVMIEYYKAPQATADAIEPDGWLHTEDMGWLDRDGFVFVTGRLKELIIKGGENIAPREIDEVLYRHTAVLEAAAVGIPDKHYGEDILACVALRPGKTCSQSELQTYCLKHLGRFKTPRIIRFLPELPKGPSGKIQRLKLPEIFGY